MNTHTLEKNYWTKRYKDENTGWDIGKASTPLVKYIDQLTDKSIKILIPGAGNAYEAEYLYNKGFENIFVLDIAKPPLENLKKRVPSFPIKNCIQDHFFSHDNAYDLIFEQTFFCSFEPTKANRETYAKQMHYLLKPKGKLVGLWFNIPLIKDSKRPFGGSLNTYLQYLNPYFDVKLFEPCINSIPSRKGKELFGIFVKK